MPRKDSEARWQTEKLKQSHWVNWVRYLALGRKRNVPLKRSHSLVRKDDDGFAKGTKISPANINAIIFIRFGYASPWSPKRFALRFIVCVITLHYQSDLHEFELVETTSGSIASFLSSFGLHSNGSRSGDGFSEWKSSSENRVPPLDFPPNEWMAHWRLPTGKHKCSTKYHEFKLVIPTNKK